MAGPAALTIAEAAAIISDETGQTIKRIYLDLSAWIAGAIANGIPPEYGAVLRQLIETVAISQLTARRERLVAQQTEARFGVADSYDRASRAQGTEGQ